MTGDPDLRSNFDLDLSRSNNISFEVTPREKHDGAIADSLSLLVQKLLVKNILHVTANLTILAYADLTID